MTEFADLGAHCALAECGQQDFLPFECKHCAGRFCLEHRMPESHACDRHVTRMREEEEEQQQQQVVAVEQGAEEEEAGQAVECPLCMQSLDTWGQSDVNALVDVHIRSGCRTRVLQRQEKTMPAKAVAATAATVAGPKRTSHVCSAPGCRQKDLVPLLCRDCGQHTCLRHRWADDHACDSVRVQEQPDDVPVGRRGKGSIFGRATSNVAGLSRLVTGLTSAAAPQVQPQQQNRQRAPRTHPRVAAR